MTMVSIMSMKSKTGLYRLMQLFSQTIDMIESKEVQDIYNENKKKIQV